MERILLLYAKRPSDDGLRMERILLLHAKRSSDDGLQHWLELV